MAEASSPPVLAASPSTKESRASGRVKIEKDQRKKLAMAPESMSPLPPASIGAKESRAPSRVKIEKDQEKKLTMAPKSTSPLPPASNYNRAKRSRASSRVKIEKDPERILSMAPENISPFPLSPQQHAYTSRESKKDQETSLAMAPAQIIIPLSPASMKSISSSSLLPSPAASTENLEHDEPVDAGSPDHTHIDSGPREDTILMTTAAMARAMSVQAKEVARQQAEVAATETGSIRPGAYRIAAPGYSYFDDDITDSEETDQVLLEELQSTMDAELNDADYVVQDEQALADSRKVCQENGDACVVKCFNTVTKTKWLVLLSVLLILTTAGLVGGILFGLNNNENDKSEVLFHDFPTIVPTASPSRWDPWQELGESIVGHNTSASFGASIALSWDGQIMISGSTGSSLVYGRVQAFQRTDDDSWVTLGQSLDSNVHEDGWGTRIVLSRDGTTLALSAYKRGLVKVFSLEDSQWVQRGSDIYVESSNSRFGVSLDISPDGNVLAVGDVRDAAIDLSPGSVYIYNWNVTSWVQQGAVLVGEENADRFGHSVSLSRDSSRIAIGIRRLDMVAVYQYDTSNSTWIKVGSDISAGTNNTSAIHFGSEVSLSSDGTILAVGAPYTDLNGTNSGSVHFFSWDGTYWNERGSPITGQNACDHLGWFNTMRLSEDGSVLCTASRITTSQRPCGPEIPGFVRVFKWDGYTWTQRGYDVDGVSAGELFGGSVALSQDGFFLVVGAPTSDSNGVDSSGRVQAYRFEDSPR